MDRRELFKIAAAGLLAGQQASAQHSHHDEVSAPDVASYRPRFFSDAEYRAAGILCDILAPSDEMSPGAREAGAPYYMDTVLHYATPHEQEFWRIGLRNIDNAAKSKFDRPFLECDAQQQHRVFAEMAANEGNPETDLQRFFEPFKQMTVEAYSLSDAGMHEYLGYRGDTMLTEFPGCTHPEHQS